MLAIEDVWYLHNLDEERNKEPFLFISNFITNEEIKFIKDHVDHEAQESEVWSSKTQSFIPNNKVRNSPVAWLSPSVKKFEPIFRKLTDVIIDVNNNHYRFNLSFIESVQYTKYIGSDDQPGFYGRHTDHSNWKAGFVDRKLSFSIILSDPETYEGGDLLLHNEKQDVITAPREKNLLILFPSYTLHEVTPVTSGTRISLVGWVNGPEWK